MDEKELARLYALSGTATPGPWRATLDRVNSDTHEPFAHIACCNVTGDANADAAFIAEARTALPALIREVQETRAAWVKVRGIVKAAEAVDGALRAWEEATDQDEIDDADDATEEALRCLQQALAKVTP